MTAWKLVQGLATGTWTHDGHGMHVDYTIIVHHWTTSNRCFHSQGSFLGLAMLLLVQLTDILLYSHQPHAFMPSKKS